MPTFYIDGQSLGNEQIGQPRKASLAIAFRWEGTPPETPHVRVVSEEIGDKTNNEAEYHALIRLLSLLRSHSTVKGVIGQGIGEVRICSDSEVLVRQMNGEYRVKEDRLRKLKSEAERLRDELGSVRLEKIPRDENLAGLWIEGKIRGVQVQPEKFLLGV